MGQNNKIPSKELHKNSDPNLKQEIIKDGIECVKTATQGTNTNNGKAIGNCHDTTIKVLNIYENELNRPNITSEERMNIYDRIDSSKEKENELAQLQIKSSSETMITIGNAVCGAVLFALGVWTTNKGNKNLIKTLPTVKR